MRNHVIIVIKQPLERIPPIINLIDALIEKGILITVLATSVTEVNKIRYKDHVNFIIIDIVNNDSRLGKIFAWITFRKKVFQYLKEHSELLNKSILWIGSADAALALGKDLFKYRYVFQCHELYDAFPLYKKRLKKVMQKAVVNVNPDDNRGAIFRSWYKLKETPITLSNKPFYHPKERQLKIEDKAVASQIEVVKGKKILLYQGGIVAQRDVRSIAKAVEFLKKEWVLVLMGNTDASDYLSSLLKDFPETIYIPSVTAPKHLQITSWARIGILSYSFDDINHVFCAPNKTWEYAGFGIPVLSSDVPGVMNDVKKYNNGISLNLENFNIQNIVTAIQTIDRNYDVFVKNANMFFNSVDIYNVVVGILKKYEEKIK